MRTVPILSHDSGDILACEDNPNYYVKSKLNSLAIARNGDVYRNFSAEGSENGWVLICAAGGPRLGDLLEMPESSVKATPPAPPAQEEEEEVEEEEEAPHKAGGRSPAVVKRGRR